MRSHAIVLSLLSALLPGCSAPRPTTGDAALYRHRDDWCSPDADDGDLTPIPPFESCDSYELAVRERLLAGVDDGISMVCIPSFRPEYALALVDARTESRSRPDGSDGPEVEWTLVIVQAEKQIWGLWPRNSEPRPTADEIEKRAPLKRTIIPLDAETASAIFDAWAQVVSRTRYHRPAIQTYPDGTREYVGKDMGSDGETYSFRAWANSGETWSPRRGMAGDLVRFADHLVELSGIEAASRAAALRKCRKEATQLFDSAQRQPW